MCVAGGAEQCVWQAGLQEADDEGYIGILAKEPFAAVDYEQALRSLDEMWQNVLQMRKSLTNYGNSDMAGDLLKAFLLEAQVTDACCLPRSLYLYYCSSALLSLTLSPFYSLLLYIMSCLSCCCSPHIAYTHSCLHLVADQVVSAVVGSTVSRYP